VLYDLVPIRSDQAGTLDLCSAGSSQRELVVSPKDGWVRRFCTATTKCDSG
jgi:hypothetical protein